MDLADPGAVSGVLLLVGSLLFGVGASNPALMRVWTAPDATALPLIHAHGGAWRLTNRLMVAAAALCVPGLWVAADVVAHPLARVGAVAYLVASTLWMLILLYRLGGEPARAARFVAGAPAPSSDEAFGRWTGALFATWCLLSGAALVAFGAGWVLAGLPLLPALFVLGAGAIEIVGFLVTGDVPPFVAYIGTLAVGIALVLG